MFSLNQQIQLDPIRISLHDPEKNIIGTCTAVIKMEFNHSFKVKLVGNLQREDLNTSSESDKITYIKIKDNDEYIRVNPSSVKYSETIEFILRPLNSSFFVGKSQPVSKVKFYITNLDQYFNDINFKIGKWSIELKANSEYEEYKYLKSNSGFLITHEGTIKRQNDDEFRKEETANLQTYLYLLFTFCNGFNTCPFYLRGLDNSGNKIWYDVANNRIDRFKKLANWFDPPNIDFESFSQGFYQLFKSEIYSDHLTEIIYWYVNGNKPGIDKSVIITHTCLELISWLYLTIEKKNISKDGFEKLSASDCFSLTLTSCKIPIEVPDKLEKLSGLARGRQHIQNACQAFSLVRNKLVHPSSNQRKNLTETNLIFEANLLGCKFIELFILYKSNYKGYYFDQVNYDTFKGNVDPVPWV